MSSHVMNGYKRSATGHIMIKPFAAANFPWNDGWYDAPEKVPGKDPPAPEVRHSKPEVDMRAPVAMDERSQVKGKPGWPKGRPRGPRK